MGNRLLRRGVWLLFIVVFGYLGVQGFVLWKNRNDGFRIQNIRSSLPNSQEWNFPVTAEKQQQVHEILAQPFHYLGRGFQFYAFESSDGKYVLKFLRQQRLRAPVLYDWLPDCSLVRSLREKKCQKRKLRVDMIFHSLKVGYQDIPEEAGLIYVHLNKTKNGHQKALISDLLGDEYEVSLDETEFVLQHKATFVKPTIRALMEAGQLQEARSRIDQIFELLRVCAEKGVLDTDGALIYKNNIGFTKERAIYIDVGTLVRKDTIKMKERFSQDLRRLRPLYKWLVSHYPPLAAHFEKQQKKVLESF